MAEKYSFIQGVFGNEFLQLETTDNVKLSTLLEQVIGPAIEVYNADVTTLTNLLAYSHTDADANSKKMYADNAFKRIGPLEAPPMQNTFESWNTPQPLERFGSANKMIWEVIKQMSSKQIIEYQNSVFRADRIQLRKRFFTNMCTKVPTATADCLTEELATPKAFWNDEASQDTPRPNGQIVFNGDHDHYNAVAVADVPTDDEVGAIITHILEHEGFGDAQVILWAKQGGAALADLQALTSYTQIEGYASLLAAMPNYQNTGVAQALIKAKQSLSRTAQAVGTFREAVVMQTPDLPDEYILGTAYLGENSPMAPIGMREHPQFRGLNMMSPTGENPIIGHNAQYRRYLSGYVNDRSAGAVLFTGETTWASPTFV